MILEMLGILRSYNTNLPLEPSIRNLEPSLKNLPSGTFHLEPSIWNLPFGTFRLEPSIWNLPFGTFHLKPSIWNLPFGTFHLEPSVWNLPFGTCARLPLINISGRATLKPKSCHCGRPDTLWEAPPVFQPREPGPVPQSHGPGSQVPYPSRAGAPEAPRGARSPQVAQTSHFGGVFTGFQSAAPSEGFGSGRRRGPELGPVPQSKRLHLVLDPAKPDFARANPGSVAPYPDFSLEICKNLRFFCWRTPRKRPGPSWPLFYGTRGPKGKSCSAQSRDSAYDS